MARDTGNIIQKAPKKKPRGKPFEVGHAPLPGAGRPKGPVITLERLIHERINESLRAGDSKLIKTILYDFFTRAEAVPDSPERRKLTDMFITSDTLERIDSVLERSKREDMDFLHYRIHKTAFDIQQQALMSKRRHKFLMAGRRAGKTEAFSRMIVDVLIDGGRAHYIHKTLPKGIEQILKHVIELAKEVGVTIAESHRNEGTFTFDNGGFFMISGNDNVEAREKKRGEKWHLVIIDEAQSQAALLYLIDNILEQELIDYGGTLVIGGTGPRVRGTYWEAMFLGQWADGRPLYPDALRLNWNLSQNPHIPNHEHALEQIRTDKGYTETDSLYIREYLGRIAYDDDALVLRLGGQNYYTDDELSGWIASQPGADIRFTAGLDFGFVDSDAFGILAYSVSRPERFLVHEYKQNRIGTKELADKIREGLQYVQSSPLFARVESKQVLIYCDTGGGGKQIQYDLASVYQLPTQDAYKANRDMGIELLQDECRRGMIKVRQGGPLSDEAQRTVFARNEQDQLTREIDEITYHADMMPAVTYALRPVWWFNRQLEAEVEK